MPIFVATTIVLVLVALFAAPVLAARLGPPAVARPPVVAAFDTYLKLDSLIKGTIKLDISTSKLADKWTVTSLKCDDVTVVATDSQGVVATAKATPGADPASCVYSMKVPSGDSLSIYADIGSAQSVGVTGFPKLADGTFPKAAITSDLKKQSFLKINSIKSDYKSIKLTTGESETLPISINLQY
ncbi:MAG: hypothetical protein ABSH03_10300 [Candidatus Lustribacter sp.]